MPSLLQRTVSLSGSSQLYVLKDLSCNQTRPLWNISPHLPSYLQLEFFPLPAFSRTWNECDVSRFWITLIGPIQNRIYQSRRLQAGTLTDDISMPEMWRQQRCG